MARIKSTGGGGGGTINTTEDVGVGIGLTQRFDQSGTALATGIAVAQGPIGVTVAQTPGISLVHSASGVPTVSVGTGLALSQRMTLLHGDDTGIGAEIVQITYTLARLVGANVVDNVGTFSWTNPTNAQGTHDASVATMAGDLTTARDGVLRFAYLNIVNDHSELTITGAFLDFYVATAGTVAANGEMNLAYRADGTTTYAGSTALETITGNVTSTSTPRTFDVSAVVNTWAEVDNVTAFVRGHTDIGETLINYTAAAVELRIEATVTDVL